MPMGGLGSRFANVGVETPKPLIEVDGMPMFLKALKSFEQLDCEKKLICVIRREHVDKYNLGSKIQKSYPGAEIVVLEKNTQGAVETCMKAAEVIDDEMPLISMDCDLYFQSKGYEEVIKHTVDRQGTSKIGGGLLYRYSQNPAHSFAEIKDGIVVRTAEKQVISETSLIGGYLFGSGKMFKDAARKLLQKNISKEIKEYYLSLLYNYIIEDGYQVLAAQVDEYSSFGTPEELESYNKSK